MPSVLSSTLLALASAASVSAHGYVRGIQNSAGSYETGWLVDYAYDSTPPASIGWAEAALDLGYVSPAAINGPDIICHLNGTNAALSHTVAAGDTMDVFWSSWPDTHKGPVIDYLASCNGDCSTVDKTTLEFFKIDEAGLDNDVWASDTLIANNASWAVTIPSTIAPGNYVLRHEIIALHGGASENGAQIYPFCINLEVTGSGTDVPAGTLGEALYTATDPGILVNIYVDDLVYEIPGPALYDSGSTGSTSGSNSTTPAATSAVASSAPVATSAVAVSSAVESITSVSVAAVVPTTLATLVRSSTSVEAVATAAPVTDEEVC